MAEELIADMGYVPYRIGVDIHIQNDTPDSGTSNWLPAPEGGFNLCARLYYPKPEALDGTWTPPAVTKV